MQRIEPGALQLHEEIHLSADQRIAARYIDDHCVEIGYLQIESDDGEHIVQLAAGDRD